MQSPTTSSSLPLGSSRWHRQRIHERISPLVCKFSKIKLKQQYNVGKDIINKMKLLFNGNVANQGRLPQLHFLSGNTCFTLNAKPTTGRIFMASSVGMLKRTSPSEVHQEIQRCYELIHRLGRGVLYLGTSRVKSDHPHYLQTLELGRDIASLLDCTTWTGAGPGLMDAATKGALEAGKHVGGFKIGREAGEWTASNFHPYLPSETYLTCRFFSARKHGLVDAVVRSTASERTAVIALPGGIGTLDEIFEILALIQLERIGSVFPVPFLLMNYDSFYLKLLAFLDDCEGWGTLSEGEISKLLKVCNDNSEALEYLGEFYGLP